MILAGIDEAGYGPLLGPLLIGCCAIEVPHAAEPPDLWHELRQVLSKARDRAGRKLHVNDSKQVYTPARGLKELERGILCFAAACHGRPETLDELLRRMDPPAPALLAEHRWYGAADGERFPVDLDPVSLRMMINAFQDQLQKTGIRIAHLGAKIAPERYLNRMFEATRNKSSVLFSLSAMHLYHLLTHFSGQRLIIHCDRQGGREHYGSLLRQMFDEWSLTIVSEEESRAEYELSRRESRVTILFREKAESQWLPVAVASMAAKYLREALMHRFNAYWQREVPGVAPTAGYYTDGLRFLNDVDARRKEMRISDDEMIRSR